MPHRRSTRCTALYIHDHSSGSGVSSRSNIRCHNGSTTTLQSSSLSFNTSTTTTTTTGGTATSATSSVVVFPRRWPGIGASFQCTKIPPLMRCSDDTTDGTSSTTGTRIHYVNTRPTPLPMSKEYPHCTMIDVSEAITNETFLPQEAGKKGT
jgi:hypothetical protein